MIATKPKSILLIDDDNTTNFLNELFISQLSYDIKVNIATNGKEAIDMLVNEENFHGENASLIPCLILLDTNMPIMDGWNFLEAFHIKISEERKDEIAIVMTSSLNSDKEVDRAMAYPFVKECAQKPLSDVKIKKLIENYFK